MDSELGFVFWLGQALDKSGFRALPAKSCADARVLLRQLRVAIDLLIIGHSMAEARSFSEDLQRSSKHLKTMVVFEPGERLDRTFPAAHALHHKPLCADEAAEIDWLDAIQSVLTSFGEGRILPARVKSS